jgi:WXG100 family type VII secretion target
MSIALDHSAFDAALRDVRDAAAQLRHARNQASRRVEAFLSGGWTGLAAGAFIDAWSDWGRAADEVLTGLVMIGDLLDATHADLSERDLGSHLALVRVTTRLHDRLG